MKEIKKPSKYAAPIEEAKWHIDFLKIAHSFLGNLQMESGEKRGAAIADTPISRRNSDIAGKFQRLEPRKPEFNALDEFKGRVLELHWNGI